MPRTVHHTAHEATLGDLPGQKTILYCGTCGKRYAESKPVCECKGPTKTFRRPLTPAALTVPPTRQYQRRHCPYCEFPIVPRVAYPYKGIWIIGLWFPWLLGIPLLILELLIGSRRRNYMECIGCHKTFRP